MAGRIWHTFAKPNREPKAPVGEVRTSVTVGGDVSGQLAVGSHIVQMRVDSVLGNLVTVLPPNAKPNSSPRPVPINLVPPAARPDGRPGTRDRARRRGSLTRRPVALC